MKTAMIVFLLSSAMCGSATAQTADEQAIAQTYNEWVAVTNDKDIDRWVAFLAPDALFLPPDSKALNTHDDIRQYYLTLFADPHWNIACQQLDVEIAKSGDMAWATGTCEATFTGADGDKARGASKWAKVWLKQPGGDWRCRMNTWNVKP